MRSTENHSSFACEKTEVAVLLVNVLPESQGVQVGALVLLLNLLRRNVTYCMCEPVSNSYCATGRPAVIG